MSFEGRAGMIVGGKVPAFHAHVTVGLIARPGIAASNSRETIRAHVVPEHMRAVTHFFHKPPTKISRAACLSWGG
jgi:hypothetical protein